MPSARACGYTQITHSQCQRPASLHTQFGVKTKEIEWNREKQKNHRATITYRWNWCKYAGGNTEPPGKCGYRNAAKLDVSNGFLKLNPKCVNGLGGSDDATTVADGTWPPLGMYGLYGWPVGPTFSCLRHFARRFWNQTCDQINA